MEKVLDELRRYEIKVDIQENQILVSAIRDGDNRNFAFQAVRLEAGRLNEEEKSAEISNLVNSIYRKISTIIYNELQLLPTN